jgi:hypothetical protein
VRGEVSLSHGEWQRQLSFFWG